MPELEVIECPGGFNYSDTALVSLPLHHVQSELAESKRG